METIVAHANRVRTRFEAGDLLDRETVKSLLATVLLTGASEPEICVTAITTLLRKCGFTKPEIARVKAGMQLEERITGGGSIFGWFGAAPQLQLRRRPFGRLKSAGGSCVRGGDLLSSRRRL